MAEVEARKRLWEAAEEGEDGEERQKQRTGGSVLGQIHLDLAKYHEMQRFTEPDSTGYDRKAALYYLRHAADCGHLEAIITMARVALNLPHDVLPDLCLEETVENADLGVDYMRTVCYLLTTKALIDKINYNSIYSNLNRLP